MFCSKCGNELAEGSAFCNRCGNPVDQNPAPVASSAAFVGAAPNSALAGVHGASPAASEGADSSSAPAGAAAAKKKPMIPIALAVIIIAVIGVAIGVAVATGGFGLLGNSVSPKDSLEEYTWEELSAISAEIATASDEDAAIEIAKTYNLVNEDGTLDGTQTKSVTLTDGTVTSVQIAGFVHDEKSDGSGKAGITFIFTDAIAEMYMNSDGYNTGGWESSDMRSWLASDGKALLPEELQEVIVAVDKPTNNVGMTEDVSSVTTTSDELWLFSCAELWNGMGELYAEQYGEDGEYENMIAIIGAEGSQYKLFSDYGVDFYTLVKGAQDGTLTSDDILTTFNILVKTYLGEPCYWWWRSPDLFSSDGFEYVCSGGDPHTSGGADNSLAVVPGFCI